MFALVEAFEKQKKMQMEKDQKLEEELVKGIRSLQRKRRKPR